MRSTGPLVLAAVGCALTTPANASTPPEAFDDFEWVLVFNPGNEGEEQMVAMMPTILGAVDYIFAISAYEVTNDQYACFLNAVAATDPNTLYNPLMETSARGGIVQSGASGSFSYDVKPGRGNNPVVWVSFLDCMRFVNWVENGMPTGAAGPETTEEGTYTISDGLTETRNPNATYFLSFPLDRR